MAVTILETLQNADYNLQNTGVGFGIILAKEQVHNATMLLEKGYSIYDEVEPLIDKYVSVDEVPLKDIRNELNAK